MAEITAAAVKSLRDRTGLPMMDCKKALQEAGGAPEKAVDGDPETRWATDNGTRQAWLEVDLGKPVTFSRAMIAGGVFAGASRPIHEE